MRHGMAMCVAGTALFVLVSGCTVSQGDSKKNDSEVRGGVPLVLVDKGASSAVCRMKFTI